MSKASSKAADESVLEPLSAYKTQYKTAFEKNCGDYFDGLVKKSGIDLAENRKTVAAYEAQNRLLSETERRLKRFRCFRVLLIIWIVLGAVFLAVSIVLLLRSSFLAGGVLLGLGIVSVVLSAVLLVRSVVPVLRKNEEAVEKLKKKAEELLARARKQMEPLNALFENNTTKPLIEKTVPLLHLDENFNVRRYDYLSGKYGYGKDDPAASTIGILTGEIVGNPFVEERVLVHSMGSRTYTGSIVIHWETVHTDSEGHTRTTHHSQTLTASVTRPEPVYREETRLVYGNEAAPDLHFSRRPTHAENDSERELARKVGRGVKKIRKRQKEAMKHGKSFTEMGNAEFDALFGAIDRDDDVQFRLLFTPLAQKNLLALMKDKAGFGDDFYLRKSGCLNYVSSEHSARWDMEERCERYRSYSADIARERFMSFHEQYFRALYFDLAPLLSIPLYQQHKPHEYLYRDSYPRCFTRQETEYAVNRLDPAVFAPVGAATKSILKTTFLSMDGKSDRVRVTASAYRAEPRTEFVSVFGGDGAFHQVPVHWTEYIPISADTDVCMKEFGLSEREFRAEADRGSLRPAIGKYGALAYGYRHGILCCVVPGEAPQFDQDLTIKKEIGGK